MTNTCGWGSLPDPILARPVLLHGILCLHFCLNVIKRQLLLIEYMFLPRRADFKYI